jgi:hypothetical protein
MFIRYLSQIKGLVMYLEKQVITIDLAKRLKELGCTQQSLFYWVRMTLADEKIEAYGLTYLLNIFEPKDNIKELYSAYTASELGFMMPYSYQKNGKTHFIETTAGHTDHEYCTVCSSHFYEGLHSSDAIIGDDFDGEGNEADARAMMFIHLIENKLIEVIK